MSRRKVKWEPDFYRLYAWATGRKASRACIGHHVARAAEDFRRARDPEIVRQGGEMQSEMQIRYARQRRQSVHQIARGSLEYARLRAYMPGAYSGYPGDRPMHDEWFGLNPHLASPWP